MGWRTVGLLFVLTISQIGRHVMVHSIYRFFAFWLQNVPLSIYRAKLGQGLLSGEYSSEVPEEPEEVKEPTIRVCLTTHCIY